jgi:hypothetical protein
LVAVGILALAFEDRRHEAIGQVPHSLSLHEVALVDTQNFERGELLEHLDLVADLVGDIDLGTLVQYDVVESGALFDALGEEDFFLEQFDLN